MNREDWPLVVEPTPARGVELYRYYYVVPENQVITWIEPMDGYILFQECTMASQWDHKSVLPFFVVWLLSLIVQDWNSRPNIGEQSTGLELSDRSEPTILFLPP